MKLHTISYAYPSSQSASDLGRGGVGCWTLDVTGAVSPYDSYGQALEAAARAGSQPSRWSVDNVLNERFAPEAS